MKLVLGTPSFEHGACSTLQLTHVSGFSLRAAGFALALQLAVCLAGGKEDKEETPSKNNGHVVGDPWDKKHTVSRLASFSSWT